MRFFNDRTVKLKIHSASLKEITDKHEFIEPQQMIRFNADPDRVFIKIWDDSLLICEADRDWENMQVK